MQVHILIQWDSVEDWSFVSNLQSDTPEVFNGSNFAVKAPSLKVIDAVYVAGLYVAGLLNGSRGHPWLPPEWKRALFGDLARVSPSFVLNQE